MVDQITLSRIELLHPNIREDVRNVYINEIVPSLSSKVVCRFAYTLRTFGEQDALFAQGRTRLFDENGRKLGIVTKAKGGQSYHNYGLALDIVLLKDTNSDGKFETASWETNIDFDKDGKADWMEVVEIMKRNGWEWGGDWRKFKDAPHFQLKKPNGSSYKWQELQKTVTNGNTITDNQITYPII
jgi:peptidoglycan L-alanyl-D-glutamate endopeptidase CwlK